MPKEPQNGAKTRAALQRAPPCMVHAAPERFRTRGRIGLNQVRLWLKERLKQKTRLAKAGLSV
jgi:hypothetical protein